MVFEKNNARIKGDGKQMTKEANNVNALPDSMRVNVNAYKIVRANALLTVKGVCACSHEGQRL